MSAIGYRDLARSAVRRPARAITELYHQAERLCWTNVQRVLRFRCASHHAVIGAWRGGKLSTSEAARTSDSSVPATMQAVVCHGPRDYRLEELAVPEPGPGEALVKVEACGICASDLKCFHGAAKF